MDSMDPPLDHNSVPFTTTPISASLSSSLGLKRRASSPLSDPAVEGSRKRLKEDTSNQEKGGSYQDSRFIEELAQELQCGCCAELVYKPVLVLPCQHFFCGSCCVLWISNGGTNCPSCRSISTIVTPFRALQGTIDAFLRAAPHRTRTERERQQADEIYSGHNLRLPAPREASPEPNINQNTDYAHPCPHCSPGNIYGWVCPQPIPDPNIDPDHAWSLDDGLPQGHGHCGNCEIILALRAPSTTKCDMCQVSFCGINVQGRCVAAPLLAQQPHGLVDISDIIECPYVYDCFDSNNVEVEIMLDYLTAQRLTPRHIYREIVSYLQSQPRGFQPLIEANTFSDIHGVAGGIDPNPNSPRTNICRLCAAEVFLWGLKGWWIRERQKGFLEPTVASRNDCPNGSTCAHQKDLVHAREFNHIFASLPSNATHNDPHQLPPPAPPNVPRDTVGASIPIVPAAEPLPFVVDVQDDPLTSLPTTPDFRDAIDAFL
ncbi:hypothetical protein P691DRAFT_804160 [Macrolepiota fuliginosa MF-IS2]|uniref:RING-type domain-containing protein n=1 Tax=Macrolepiota fuliginosa MF-IS2 TaxID=1400762 RepID=A0A9P5XQ01_9AGAR|nr:hypothetical protein P691DRAFT_804160 [Macrolepiota fuliginosa MF-IS2]